MVQYPSGFIMNIYYNYVIIKVWLYRKCYEGLIFFSWFGFYVNMTLINNRLYLKNMKLHSSPYRYHPAIDKTAACTALRAKENSHFFNLKS